MATGRYNTIQIGNYYLTKDGTVNTSNCKTEVEGLDAILSNYTLNTITALDGTPYNQVTLNYKKGLPLVIRIFQTTNTRLDELQTLIDSAVLGSSSILVKITGPPTQDETISINCLPTSPVQFTGEFQNSMIKDITLNFVVRSIDNIITVSPGTLTLTGQSVTLTQA